MWTDIHTFINTLHPIITFLITLAVATVGGLLGIKLKVPVGGMLGAMLFAATFNIVFDHDIFMPSGFNLLFQIPLGVMLGSKVQKEGLTELVKSWKPALVIILSFLTLNITFGFLIYHISDLNIATGLFATAPGGMVDMTIVSYYFGANIAIVAIIQMFRNTSVMVFIAPLYRRLIHKLPLHTSEKNQAISNPDRLKKSKSFAIALFWSASFGLLLRWLGVPAGAIIGGMLGSAIFNIITARAYFPQMLRVPMRIGSGFFIGMNITRTHFFAMAALPIVLVVVLAYVWVATFMTGFMVHKLTGLDLATSLLASTPGGLSEMAIIADELELNSPQVAVLHTARLIMVIMTFPIMLGGVIGLWYAR